MKGKIPIITALSIVASVISVPRLLLPTANAGQSTSHAAIQPKLVDAYGKLPLAFEANQGQSDQPVRFLARGNGFVLFLTADSAVLTLRPLRKGGSNDNAEPVKSGAESQPSPFSSKFSQSPAGLQSQVSTSQMPGADHGGGIKETVLRMRVVGKDANPGAKVEGLEELPGKSNYFIGTDPKKWRTNIPNYAQVKYRNVYPGVDLVYYGRQGKLEYDFVVEPGADPSRIVLDISSDATRAQDSRRAQMHVAKRGDLVIGDSGEVVLQKPFVYQPTTTYEPQTTCKQVIEGKYVLAGRHRVQFQVGAYDRNKVLVIDPTLVYSSYLGGNGWDKANGIAVDSSGNAYLAGKTISPNFPVTKGAFQTRLGGQVTNAFVTELNSAGSALIYSTYLGGVASGEALGITLDSSGNAYVTGWTASANFPTTAGALQTTFGGGYDDGFVTKLNSTGSALIYSTYLGGSSYDEGHGIAVDATGNAYVTGLSYSQNFPTIAGAFQSVLQGYDDAFVSKLNPAGSALIYSTYLGGNSYDQGNGIAVDASGNAYITGLTYSYHFPTTGQAFRTTWGGGFDAFVSKLNASGTTLLYSTYLGGSSDDYGYGIAVDASNSAYVTGRTYSPDFPTTAGAFQTTPGGTGGGGHDDAYVVKLNAAGSALVYSTYLGGSCDDAGYGIVVDSSGDALVTGDTCSDDFPTTDGSFQRTLGGADDAFYGELNPAGSALLYSTYLGGNGDDASDGIALDPSGNIYLVGWTSSRNFPTTNGAFQTSLSGIQNTFVIILSAQ